MSLCQPQIHWEACLDFCTKYWFHPSEGSLQTAAKTNVRTVGPVYTRNSLKNTLQPWLALFSPATLQHEVFLQNKSNESCHMPGIFQWITEIRTGPMLPPNPGQAQLSQWLKTASGWQCTTQAQLRGSSAWLQNGLHTRLGQLTALLCFLEASWHQRGQLQGYQNKT